MIEVLFICLMAYLSALSGGSVYPAHVFDHEVKLGRLRINFTWLPEMLFAIPFGIVGAHGFGIPVAIIPCIIWSYIWMQTGHGTVLHWGDKPENSTGERKQTLTPVVNRIAKTFKIEIGSRNYCRLFMAVKGFLIGLPAGGIPLAILWPLGYEIGYRLRIRGNADSHSIAELSCGLFAGVAILMAWYMA